MPKRAVPVLIHAALIAATSAIARPAPARAQDPSEIAISRVAKRPSRVAPAEHFTGGLLLPWDEGGYDATMRLSQIGRGWIDANTRFAQGDIRGVESRFSPENLPHNLALVAVLKSWAQRKHATPGQIALAWLLSRKPWIVPIPGTTQMAHMVENTGAAALRFTPSELAELNGAVDAIQIAGQRLPDMVLAFSGVEAPPKR